MISLRRILYRAGNRAARLRGRTRAALLGNGVDAYWWIGEKNFGDLITPLLLEHYGRTAIHSPADESAVISTGSVLEHVSVNYSGVVLGSGYLQDGPLRPLPEAIILAVRGPLTARRLGVSDVLALGDPGLLVSDLGLTAQERDCVLGVVPHYEDKSAPYVRALHSRRHEGIRVIDVQQAAEDVIREIARCQHIFSSSLHGLVVADALGVPRARIGRMRDAGHMSFKYDDYSRAIGMDAECHAVTGHEPLVALASLARRANSDDVDQAKEGLRAAFRLLVGADSPLPANARLNAASWIR